MKAGASGRKAVCCRGSFNTLGRILALLPRHSSISLKSIMHAPSTSAPWWRQLTGYHWFVILVASAAWFFDCLDQRLFSLARVPALSSLTGLDAKDPAIGIYAKEVTAWFLIGWGIGGMTFGALGRQIWTGEDAHAHHPHLFRFHRTELFQQNET